MGYTTEFYGSIAVSPPLNRPERDYLERFATPRRMDRERGPYFVEGSGFRGRGHDRDLRDFNDPPAGQPGLWFSFDQTLDGEIEAHAEEPDDEWLLSVAAHEVRVLAGRVLYGNPEALSAERGSPWPR